MTFRHILFPVDLSPRCEAARPTVAAWARKFGAKVSLLHTIHIPISSYGGPDGYPIIIDIPKIEAYAKERLDRFAIDVPDVTRIVTDGDPAFEVAEYARENGVDLIMMPTHGYGPFRSLLLGSTAAKVLHDAHCPVWTSAHIENISPTAPTEIRNILCVIEDFVLIPTASELAAAWGAKLHEIRVEGSSVSHQVRDAALESRADLVVTGPGKLHATFGQMRTNTYAIIRDSPCPVLST